jgi:preprotein translocase subunit SecA
LVEYKKEGLRMFKEMQAMVSNEVVRLLPFIGAGAFVKEEEKLREVEKQAIEISAQSRAGDEIVVGPNRDEVGRNDPCPCGSSKKYKKCCGANK